MVVVDDHGSGQGHDPHHHGEARLPGDQRRDHAGAAHDLAQRRGRAVDGLVVVGVQQLADPLRIGPDEQHEHERDRHEGDGGPPQQRERVAVELAARQQRAEHERTEDRAEDRPEQHERDAAGAPLRRVHVAGRGAGQQRGAARHPHADEPDEHDRRRLEHRAEPGEPAAEPARREPRGEHRHAPEAIHRAAGGQRRQGAGGEHDRRPEAEQLVDAEHQHQRQRGDGRRELQHPRVGGQGGRQQQRVAADGELLHRADATPSPRRSPPAAGRRGGTSGRRPPRATSRARRCA